MRIIYILYNKKYEDKFSLINIFKICEPLDVGVNCRDKTCADPGACAENEDCDDSTGSA